jgi:predicted DCC family thiol-disulfide oxidoreductase YuxK
MEDERSGTAQTRAGDARPLLVYDGDCGFCGYWARYWQALTGDRVSYRPYQDVETQYPAIARSEFQRAVQYLPPQGGRASAAEASFLTLSHAPGKDLWLRLYRLSPGFAALAERAYAFTAAHRPAFHRLSILLWGKTPEPARYELAPFLFLRLFGLIYLAAFVSFAVQAPGLIGSHGILPLAELVSTLSHSVGPARFYWLPMVFWWNSSDLALQVVCASGIVLSGMLVLNVLPRVSLGLLFVLYLSLLSAGQDFMTYQWDTFLLETGFLAFILSCARGTGLWLLRWLLFRFMFMSGMVKVLSDANWRNLSALSYHFLTQPLPTPLAWYAAQMPGWALRTATAGMLVIELGLPLLICLPRRPRRLAASGILLLQSCIVLTGNYNWFNLQTMLLCLLLFDDAALRRIVPQAVVRWAQRRRTPRLPSGVVRIALACLAGFLVLLSLLQMALRFEVPLPDEAQALVMYAEPLHLVSPYGLFAVMTTERDEIIIEGSDDGRVWREYEFRYKPGDLARRPLWNIPHQPRLDWQMWFAALEDPRQLRWFWRFLQKLLENDPAVTALLADNPFPGHPPRYLRAEFYDYTYADAAQKARGLWWQRRLLGPYAPVVQLGGATSN